MRVLIVVARRYNGHELGAMMRGLAAEGHKFRVLSTAHVIEDEVTGEPLRIKYLIGEVKPVHDALVVTSGNMADTELYWHHEQVLDYVEKFNSAGKPIASICCSVPTIRFAAKGKTVSYFPLVRSQQLLEAAGAICSPVTMSVDSNLVTAEHQMASEMWAEEFTRLMAGLTPKYSFTESGFVPNGKSPRKLPQALADIQGKRSGQPIDPKLIRSPR